MWMKELIISVRTCDQNATESDSRQNKKDLLQDWGGHTPYMHAQMSSHDKFFLGESSLFFASGPKTTFSSSTGRSHDIRGLQWNTQSREWVC
jgi:hypothetical protein